MCVRGANSRGLGGNFLNRVERIGEQRNSAKMRTSSSAPGARPRLPPRPRDSLRPWPPLSLLGSNSPAVVSLLIPASVIPGILCLLALLLIVTGLPNPNPEPQNALPVGASAKYRGARAVPRMVRVARFQNSISNFKLATLS